MPCSSDSAGPDDEHAVHRVARGQHRRPGDARFRQPCHGARGESIFRGSWFRAGYELFYTPIPPAEKRAVKSIVDVSADRLGEPLAAGSSGLAVLFAPAVQSSAILWMAIASSTAAIFAASRLNHWYVRTLGTSLVLQAPGLGRSVTEGQLTRRMLLKVRSSRPLPSAAPADDVDDVRALRAGNRERSIAVLSREEGLSAGLVSHVIPLLAGPLSDYAAVRAAQGGGRTRRPAHRRAARSEPRLQDPAPARARLFGRRFSARGRRADPGPRRRSVRRPVPERASLAAILDRNPANPHRSRADPRGRPSRSGRRAPVWDEPPPARRRLPTSRRSTNSCAIGRARAWPTSSRCCLWSSRVSPSRSPSAACTARTAAFEGLPSSTSKACCPPKSGSGSGRSSWGPHDDPFPAPRRSHGESPPIQLLGDPARRRSYASQAGQLSLACHAPTAYRVAGFAGG